MAHELHTFARADVRNFIDRSQKMRGRRVNDRADVSGKRGGSDAAVSEKGWRGMPGNVACIAG
ncbi:MULTISPECIES: hypothetical protein [Burkholderia]|uniref:hypothetical protein n=1 Tax=Burkholderia TaxID=32008 RepID=UPI001177F403|nr:MULTISPECIES: hypothetical protein [Burkholderia]